MDANGIISQFYQIKKSADEMVTKGDSLNPEFKKVMELVHEAELSWSGSFLGYHSCVYYEGLRPKPPGAHFDQQWGFQDRYSNSSTGEWVEYDYRELYKHFISAVEPTVFESWKKTRALGIQCFNRLKDELASVFDLLGNLDDYLSERKAKASDLEILNSEQLGKRQIRVGTIFSNDMRAAQGGVRLPPHMAAEAEVMSIQYPFFALRKISEIAEQSAKHLERKLGKMMASTARGTHIFIGHGRSHVWRDLKDFIKDKLKLEYDEFNRVPVAGITNVDRLKEMLDQAAFAFIVMTAEDEMADGAIIARQNVIHEVGLFQGRLGFHRAIVVLEAGCEEFSNITGLGQLRFPKGDIKSKFEEIRDLLEREKLL